MTDIRILRLEREGCKPALPCFATEGAAAADLAAFLEAPVTILPGQRFAVPTGIALELPQGWCAFVMARSGLSLKAGIGLANGVGLIDSDYRGEVRVSLQNNGDVPFVVEDGMRVAQLLFLPVPEVRLIEAEVLSETERGSGGFGSTGLSKL